MNKGKDIFSGKERQRSNPALDGGQEQGISWTTDLFTGRLHVWRIQRRFYKMSTRFETRFAQIFAPFNFSDVPGFPNTVPTMDEWGYFLPWFEEKEEDNPAHHVIKFHQYMDQLSIHHEYVLVKMFMYSLDGSARKWYRTLPPSSISSLKDFHDTFNSYYKRIYPDERIPLWKTTPT